jgi:hypothetical protein
MRTTGMPLVFRVFSACAIGLLAGTGALAQQPEYPPQLEALARAAINARNHVIITGNEEEAIRKEPLGADVQGATRGQFERAQIMRSAATESKIAYTRASYDLTVTGAKVEGNQATLEAASKLRRDIQGPPDAPDATTEIENYVFSYTQENGRWRLSGIKLITDREKTEVPPPGIDEPALRADAVPVRPGKNPNPFNRGSRPGSSGAGAPSGDNLFYFTSRGATEPAVRRAGYYAPNAAVDYSNRWVWDYNPAFVKFTNDCTNFISQVAQAGGWTQTGLIKYSDGAWYHTTPEPSWTWGGAQNFYNFVSQSGRTWGVAPYTSDIWTGDILQFKFYGQTNIHHSMVVSKIDANGAIYLNYHSGPAQHKPLSEFLRLNPNGSLYAWMMKLEW